MDDLPRFRCSQSSFGFMNTIVCLKKENRLTFFFLLLQSNAMAIALFSEKILANYKSELIVYKQCRTLIKELRGTN